MNSQTSKCACCAVAPREKACRIEGGKGPGFCPTLNNGGEVMASLEEYDQTEIRDFARQASLQEGSCYIERDSQPHVIFPTKPRLQEICEFSLRMGYKRLGLAFCGGVQSEAGILNEFFEKQGFEVVSVVCKVGSVLKSCLGIKKEEQVNVNNDYETMCNPIAQAKVLNSARTDFNILFGLCVGHDSLFIKHSEAMVTVFAVKDRVLAHNPVAALYTIKSYYQRFLKKQ